MKGYKKNYISDYLNDTDLIKDNANIDFSVGSLILNNSKQITERYWLHHVYPTEISNAHKSGLIHIHDLSMLSGYCAGWSLRDLIIRGINGVDNKITSGPAKSLVTIVNQMVNFLGMLQNEWAGAQAFSSIDTYLAPFVKEANLSYTATKQAIQSLIFGLNVSSRWGSQAPFTNFTFDWVCPEDLKNYGAIVGGVQKAYTYGDCQQEMDLINKAFLDLFLEGDFNKRGFTYPIPTYNITKDFNWDHPNCELLFKLTGEYGTPYFQNFINSNLNPEDVRSMCCRLQLNKKILRNRGGGLFGSDELTGSIGVVTLNIPRIALLSTLSAKQKRCTPLELFYQKLYEVTNLSIYSLNIKRKTLKTLFDRGLYPYTKSYLKSFDNFFSTLGLIGVYEAANTLGIKNTQEIKEFSKSILNKLREWLETEQIRSNTLFNLEATPGEGVSYRFAKLDKKEFKIKNMYYTNSTHLPVNATDDIFKALDYQNGIQELYTGGTVFHSFLKESISSETTAELVKYICTTFKMPYITITPTYSICKEHGRLTGHQDKCDKCGAATEIYSRIVGFYRPISAWNKGKLNEYFERVTYII